MKFLTFFWKITLICLCPKPNPNNRGCDQKIEKKILIFKVTQQTQKDDARLEKKYWKKIKSKSAGSKTKNKTNNRDEELRVKNGKKDKDGEKW